MFSHETIEEIIIQHNISGIKPWRIHELTGIRYPHVKSTIQYYEMYGDISKSSRSQKTN